MVESVIMYTDEIVIKFVQYGLPVLSIVIALVAFWDTRKTNKLSRRVNEIEEQLKCYQLEEKKKEIEEFKKACVEARVYKISQGKYKMKIWNSGKATAYDVDFVVNNEEHKGMVFKDKTPYEVLESGKSYEEHVLVHMGTPRKFTVSTIWKDVDDIEHSKEQIVSI